jgi:hypothetical protein
VKNLDAGDLDPAGAHGLRDFVFQDRRTQRDID